MTHAAAHHSITAISRGAGRSATAAVAYAAGELVVDDRTGLAHDYRRKGGVASVEVVGFAGGAGELANAMELAERRKDACVARATVLALPAELPPDRRRALARGYALWLRDTYGVASVVAIHEPDRRSPDNWHAHLVETTRDIDPATGAFGSKVRELDDRKSGRVEVERRRAEWARRVNAELDRCHGRGVGARVDPRSHRRRAEAGDGPAGIMPIAHAGPARTARARKADRLVAGFWGNAPTTPEEAQAIRRKAGELLLHEIEAGARQEHNAELRETWSLLRRAELREEARRAADRLEQEAAAVAQEQRAAAVAAPGPAVAGAGARVDVRPVLDAVAALPGADPTAIRMAAPESCAEPRRAAVAARAPAVAGDPAGQVGPPPGPAQGRRPPVGGPAAAVADDAAARERRGQELAEAGKEAARRQAIRAAAEAAEKRRRQGRGGPSR